MEWIKKNKEVVILGGCLLVLILVALFTQGKGITFNEIDYAGYEKLLESKTRQVVYIANDTCDACEEQSRILKEIIKDYNIEINYINLNNLEQDDIDKIGHAIDEEATGITVPTVVIVKDGQIESINIKLINEEEMVDFLRDANVIFTLKEISVEEYLEVIAEDKENIIMIGRPSCPHCVNYKPVLEEALQEAELHGYYLNTDNIVTQEEYDSFLGSFDEFEGGVPTPTTIITKKGAIIELIEGEVTLENTTEYLTNNGLIK